MFLNGFESELSVPSLFVCLDSQQKERKTFYCCFVLILIYYLRPYGLEMLNIFIRYTDDRTSSSTQHTGRRLLLPTGNSFHNPLITAVFSLRPLVIQRMRSLFFVVLPFFFPQTRLPLFCLIPLFFWGVVYQVTDWFWSRESNRQILLKPDEATPRSNCRIIKNRTVNWLQKEKQQKPTCSQLSLWRFYTF